MSYILIYILFPAYYSASPSLYKEKKIVQEKSIKLTDLEILTYLNNLSTEYQIKILDIKILTSTIEIHVLESYQNITIFLGLLANNFEIKEFEMKKNDNKISLDIYLDRRFFYNAHINKLSNQDLLNPFIEREDSMDTNKKELTISAIINHEVLIDNDWYIEGDTVFNYKIISIKDNKVVLLDIDTKENLVKSINDA